MTGGGAEKRRSRRVAVDGKVQVGRNGVNHEGRLVDISRTGLLVRLPQEIDLGVFYALVVSSQEMEFMTQGEAVRTLLPFPGTAPDSPEGSYRTAFDFLSLTPEAMEVIGHLMGAEGIPARP